MTSPAHAPPRTAPPLPSCRAATIRPSPFAVTLSLAAALAGCDLSLDAFAEARLPEAGHVSQAGESAPPLAPVDVVALLDQRRAELGLPPLGRSPELAAAATAHAGFLAAHAPVYDATGLSWHLQREDLPGYTGETPADRAAHFGHAGPAPEEVVAARPHAAAALRDWLDSLYHRLPLLAPHATAGAGDHAGFHVLETASAAPAGTAPHVVYPPAGADDVAPAWDGNELPRPPAPPAGFPSGPVITLQTPATALTLLEATLTPAGAAAALPAQALTAANDPHLPPGVAALVPHAPLAPDHTYDVRLRGLADGVPFDHRWSFTTAPERCDPASDRCGLGRACYPGPGGPECRPTGAAAQGEACGVPNDCAAGLTCLGARCTPVCTPDTSAAAHGACDRCVHGWLDVGGLGACLPPPCLDGPAACGADEACTWMGGFVCARRGVVPQGAPCEAADACAPGLACLSLGGGYRCRALCGAGGLPPCQGACEAGSAPLGDPSGAAVCL